MDSDDPVGKKCKKEKRVIKTRRDPDDMIERAYGKRKRTIKIPLNGSQKIEIKNISKEELSLEGNIHSHRFTCLNSLRSQAPGYSKFEVDLHPDNSIVIQIKDNGHVELDNRDQPSYVFEGVFRYFAKGYIQAIILRPDPDTESYRKLRAYVDNYADCDFGIVEDDKIDEFISIEPISDTKYGETLPNNVKILELDADGERHNAVMKKAYQLSHIPEFMNGNQYDKACEILKKYDEQLRKAQQESKKSQLVSTVSQSKRSEKPEKSSLSENPKSAPKSEKTTKSESAAPESKRSVTSEKSEAKSITKSTVKSEKSTKSEVVQKSEKLEQKNEEKKKKKKKKRRCVIC